VNVLRP
jgi:hypothetical protein